MNKTYKIQLPRNKEAQNIRTNIKNGTIEVEVELKERWKPRDGDICYIKACYEHIFVFNELNYNDVMAYIAFAPRSKRLSDFNKIAIICDTINVIEFRPATNSEKQLLFDALAKEGKMWDAEKKQVVDLPRWRAEKEESYFHVFIDPIIQMQVIHATDFRCYADEKRYQLGNYFKTEEAAERVVKQIREIFKNSKAE